MSLSRDMADSREPCTLSLVTLDFMLDCLSVLFTKLAHDIRDLLVGRNIKGNELRASARLAPQAIEKTLIFILFLCSELHSGESPKNCSGAKI